MGVRGKETQTESRGILAREVWLCPDDKTYCPAPPNRPNTRISLWHLALAPRRPAHGRAPLYEVFTRKKTFQFA
jgi:hypothetical protein